MSLIHHSMYSVSGFLCSVLIPIDLTNMAVSCPGIVLSHTCRKYFSNIPGVYEEIWTWSYRHNVILRRSKDRLEYIMQKAAFL